MNVLQSLHDMKLFFYSKKPQKGKSAYLFYNFL